MRARCTWTGAALLSGTTQYSVHSSCFDLVRLTCWLSLVAAAPRVSVQVGAVCPQ
ncbi:hypothetical protein [Streptomyces ambofaciens]|uniref:hypothetical protein n=1 Tax=Streptomyces ambofaciens TaxID=1889 RepID=UPI000A6510B5|nr:hypothetical protein [Streptomyces ambofaciens]